MGLAQLRWTTIRKRDKKENYSRPQNTQRINLSFDDMKSDLTELVPPT
jgi:hypothetical protein